VLATSLSWRNDVFMTKSRQFSEIIFAKKLHFRDNIVTHYEAESAKLRLN
jgi:hypothetical protein